MIAIDTSSLIAYFQGLSGHDVDAVEFAFEGSCAVFPPVVLTEMLSDHRLKGSVVEILLAVPRLTNSESFWQRAGLTRARILKRGYKARLADTLIAQTCIDNGVPLISRDEDYRHFVKHAGLVLYESVQASA